MSEESLSQRLERSTARCLAMDAPLAERLQAFADDVQSISPEFAAIVERLINRLRTVGVGGKAPKPGEPMPPFLLPNQDGRLIGLEALVEDGPVIISFHRGQWCPYCRINADALARLQCEIEPMSAQIVAITPNLQQFNAELRNDVRAPFPILTDLDNGYALQLDLAFRVPDEKRKAMSESGWDIAPFQGTDGWLLPIPATFVVGTDGIVKARFIDPDYRKRMAIEDILSALHAR